MRKFKRYNTCNKYNGFLKCSAKVIVQWERSSVIILAINTENLHNVQQKQLYNKKDQALRYLQ